MSPRIANECRPGPDLERLLKDKLESGEYRPADEVINAAMGFCSGEPTEMTPEDSDDGECDSMPHLNLRKMD